MSRPIKNGLYYFPMDVDFFDDIKIQHIRAKFGLRGELITVKLLAKIYRDGYYLRWNEDSAMLFSMMIGDGCTLDEVTKIVEELLKRDFFDAGQYIENGILTSRGIQKRYVKICQDARRKYTQILNAFSVLPQDEPKTELTQEETAIPPEFNTQIKENKIKIENSYTSTKRVEVKPDFIDSILEIFCSLYLESRKEEYFITTRGKERNAIVRLLKIYKSKNKEPADTDKTIDDFTKMFRTFLNVNDKWHYARMSPNHIYTNLNQLKIIIKGNYNAAGNPKTTDEDFAGIIFKHFGKKPS